MKIYNVLTKLQQDLIKYKSFSLQPLSSSSNRECAFGLSGRGRGGSRLPGTHSTQFIGHEVMRLSTYYCAREAYCSIV